MKREDLEHLLRACGDIIDDDEILVIGSQSILGQFPDAPESLRVSVEADLVPMNHPERSDLIDGTIGELSPFHATYGYYAQGVSRETAVLPRGWQGRLVRLVNANTRGVTGFCLEIHDLAIAKAVAGRDKDRAFVRDLLRHRMVDRATLLGRLEETPVEDVAKERIRAMLGSPATTC